MPLNQQYTFGQQSSCTTTEKLSQMHRYLSQSKQKHNYNDTIGQISITPSNDITTNLSQKHIGYKCITWQQTSQRLENGGFIPSIMDNKISTYSMLSNLNRNPIFVDDLMKTTADMASFGNINTQGSPSIRESEASHNFTSQHIYQVMSDPALKVAKDSNLLQYFPTNIRPMHIEQSFAQSHGNADINKLLSHLK